MRRLSLAMAVLFAALTTPTQAQGPGSAGVLFLLIQPSVRANSMGGASVTALENDALAIAFNPAHLGLAARNHLFTAEFYPAAVQWLPQLASDLTYDVKVFYAGYDFRNLNPKLPLSAGVAYSRVAVDLGAQVITDEPSPDPLGTFEASENSDAMTLAAGIDLPVKIGLGWSIKWIDSNLSPLQEEKASATAHDLGVKVLWPVFETFSHAGVVRIGENAALRPTIVPSLAYSKSNIGGEISYIDAAQADPLPRVARVAVGLNAGVEAAKGDLRWRLVNWEWTRENEQLLVRHDDQHNVSYASFLGDIKFWKNTVLGEYGAEIISKRGWELNFFELFALRRGTHEDPLSRVRYDSKGFSIGLSGAMKALGFVYADVQSNKVWQQLYRHFNLTYSQAEWDLAAGHPFAGTKFKSLRIELKPGP